jgi:FkbM family methyltransferase
MLKALRSSLGRSLFVRRWARRANVGPWRRGKNEWDYVFELRQRHSGKNIFVLQIGANDGKRSDFLRPFIRRYKWRGLLLEPLPDIFSALRENYADTGSITLLNAALAESDGVRTFYRVRTGPGVPDYFHGLGSFYREVVAKHVAFFQEIERYIVEESITAISFPTLIRQQGIKRIDAVVIDTEGYDFQILKMIDFRQFQPKLVIYEHKHLSNADRECAAQLLKSLGYEVHPIESWDANTAAVYSQPTNPS